MIEQMRRWICPFVLIVTLLDGVARGDALIVTQAMKTSLFRPKDLQD